MKTRLLTSLLLCISICLFGQEYTVIPNNPALPPILTPSLAEQKTMKLRLNNGLEVYLISNPELNQSAAVMVVETGANEDPKDVPGEAHLLEHIIHLGSSEKYPEILSFKKLVIQNGGRCNALTYQNRTYYPFSINHCAFQEAIERFADSFKAPLFDPTMISKEIQSVHEEYMMRKRDSPYRFWHVLKDLALPEHSFRHFILGNAKTLANVSNIQLKQRFESYYSANRMKLVLSSALSLEVLKDLVINNFEPIPNHNVPLHSPSAPVFSSENKGSLIRLDSSENARMLTMIWEFPSTSVKIFDEDSWKIISKVINDKGDNSLFSDLQKNQLATSVDCGYRPLDLNNNYFYIDIDLTPRGLQEPLAVVIKCFEVINNLKSTGIPQFVFDEMKVMSKLEYQYYCNYDAFVEMNDIVEEFSSTPIEFFPRSPTESHFDSQAISDRLSLLTVDSCLAVLAIGVDQLDVKYDLKEPFMDISYKIDHFEQEFIEKCNKAMSDASSFRLPSPNPYIPDQLQVIHPIIRFSDSLSLRPEILCDKDCAKIYFVPDTIYGTPEVSISFYVKTPIIQPTFPSSIVLVDLYLEFLNRAIQPLLDKAQVAGLNILINRQKAGSNQNNNEFLNNGWYLKVSGYSDKAELLINDIINAIRNLSVNNELFEEYKKIHLEDYLSRCRLDTIAAADQEIQDRLFVHYLSDEKKAKILKTLTFDDFQSFIAQLFNETFIEGMLYGNITKQQALSISEKFLSAVNARSYPKDQHFKLAFKQLSDDNVRYLCELKTSVYENGVKLAIQMEPFSLKNRAAQRILLKAINEPFHKALRSEQQTGYHNRVFGDMLQNRLINYFEILSTAYEGRDLLERIEAFIEKFVDNIENEIPYEPFVAIKNSLVASLKKRPNNLYTMHDRLSLQAFEDEGDFDLITKRIEIMENLSYEEFLEIARQALSKNNQRRIAVIISGPDEEQ